MTSLARNTGRPGRVAATVLGAMLIAGLLPGVALGATAPTITQGQNIGGGRGSPCPRAIITPARKTSAKGKPKRNRTCVAPTVPSFAVSSRCVALRTVCAAAAIIVKRAQSHEGSSIANLLS